MSSTYVHYSSSPGSLPADYGLIARYQQNRDTHDSHDHHNEHTNPREALLNDHDINEEESFQAHDVLYRRRNSFAYGTLPHRPSNLNINPNLKFSLDSPDAATLTETEPLLGHIPRIPEETDSTSHEGLDVWWNEVRSPKHIAKTKIKPFSPALDSLQIYRPGFWVSSHVTTYLFV